MGAKFGVEHDYEDGTFERLGLTRSEAEARAAELAGEGIDATIFTY